MREMHCFGGLWNLNYNTTVPYFTILEPKKWTRKNLRYRKFYRNVITVTFTSHFLRVKTQANYFEIYVKVIENY